MDRDYKKAANITIIAAGMLLLFWLFVRYALGAVLPFLLGAAVAAIVSPISKNISKTTQISRKVVSASLVLIFFSTISTLLYFAGARLVEETGNLIDKLSQDTYLLGEFIDQISARISDLGLGRGSSGARVFESIGVDVGALVDNSINSIISSISSAIPSFAVKVVAGIPSFIFFTVVFLISAFYFSTDREIIGKGIRSFIPDSWHKKLPTLKERLKKTVSGYLKAYFFLMLLTFAEIFIGLSILKVNYALLLAILIAVVDILPLIGTGTILIPWAIFSFITGNAGLGSGLLILYGIVLIVRQFAEPKIVGSSIGLHPLATLASVYLGIKFAGFLGIFIGPIVALCIKGFSKEPT